MNGLLRRANLFPWRIKQPAINRQPLPHQCFYRCIRGFNGTLVINLDLGRLAKPFHPGILGEGNSSTHIHRKTGENSHHNPANTQTFHI